MAEMTETQRKVMRMLAREPNYIGNLGGNGRGPILSAARALERKGILRRLTTSCYAVKIEFRELADSELSAWREAKAKEPQA